MEYVWILIVIDEDNSWVGSTATICRYYHIILLVILTRKHTLYSTALFIRSLITLEYPLLHRYPTSTNTLLKTLTFLSCISGAITLFETIRDMPGNYSIYCTFQCNNDHDCLTHDVLKPVVLSPKGMEPRQQLYTITHVNVMTNHHTCLSVCLSVS